MDSIRKLDKDYVSPRNVVGEEWLINFFLCLRRSSCRYLNRARCSLTRAGAARLRGDPGLPRRRVFSRQVVFPDPGVVALETLLDVHTGVAAFSTSDVIGKRYIVTLAT